MPDRFEYKINDKYPGRGEDDKANTLIFDHFESEPWVSFSNFLYSKEFVRLLLDKFSVKKKDFRAFFT